ARRPVEGVSADADGITSGADTPLSEADQRIEETRAFVRLALRPPLAVGHEVHSGRARAEQQRRVDVGVARSGPEVKRLRAGRAHHLTLRDPIAPLNADRREKRVARADAVAVQ